MNALRVGVVLKTSSGGMWVIPQIRALRERAEVVVIIPATEGRLARHLAELARADSGVSVYRTSYQFSFLPTATNVREYMRFARDLRRLRLDAVLYHLYASTLATRFALAGSSTRRVQMVAGPLQLESLVIRIFERMLLRMDHAIIGGSEDIRRRYIKLGARSNKVQAIPYGVDTQTFLPDSTGRHRHSVRKRFGVQQDAFLVVMVAFVYPPKRLVHSGRGIKGHAELLEAWHGFSRRHPDAHLLIVGGGFQAAGEHYRSQIVNALPDSLAAMRVSWVDTVEDVREMYDAADLSVSPSLSENHGAALEASAMSVPSIVSDAGGLPETVDPDESGWIVRAGDSESLGSALENAYTTWRRGDLPQMGSRARQKAIRSFDSGDAAQKVARIVVEATHR